MSPNEFHTLMETTFNSLRQLTAVKSGEYASDSDKLSNFRAASQRLGQLPEQVLLVYLDKHYAAICNFVQDLAKGRTRTRSEAIEGRVHDMMVYGVLLLALLRERGELNATATDEPRMLRWENDDEGPTGP